MTPGKLEIFFCCADSTINDRKPLLTNINNIFAKKEKLYIPTEKPLLKKTKKTDGR